MVVGNASEITNLLQSQSDKIFWLWMFLAVFFVVALIFLILFIIRKRSSNYLKVGIHMPSHKIVWFSFRKPKDLLKINHGEKANGEKDIFYYLYDSECVQENLKGEIKSNKSVGFWNVGKMFEPKINQNDISIYDLDIKETSNNVKCIQFYYRNPSPIKFVSNFQGFPVKVGEQEVENADGTKEIEDVIEYRGRTLATIEEQNINISLESDAISKFVLARALLSTMMTWLIVIGIAVLVGLALNGWNLFAGDDGTCVLQPDNSTMNTIFYASHMTAPMGVVQVENTAPVNEVPRQIIRNGGG